MSRKPKLTAVLFLSGCFQKCYWISSTHDHCEKADVAQVSARRYAKEIYQSALTLRNAGLADFSNEIFDEVE